MIIYDAEIRNAILGRGETAVPGIHYCHGWGDYIGMGIACICTYDTHTHEPRVFLEDNIAEFAEYLKGQPTAGFNSLGFDNKLLAAFGVEIELEDHFDIIRGIWDSDGINLDGTLNSRKRGWKLDNIMQHTFALAKSGSGAHAPIWWQQGRFGKVIDYCARDNWLAAKLAAHLLEGKPVICSQGTLPTYLNQTYIEKFKRYL